ncbi:MAG: hypothetical protein WD049_02300 [Candidatus Paceibacterota bacterium]
MNNSPDSLDQLLSDWAASRKAGDEHCRRLAAQILSVARDGLEVGRNESGQFQHAPNVTLPERRKALFRPTADQGSKLMIGGGGLLLILALAGCLLYYNLSPATRNNQQPARPIAASTGNVPPATAVANGYPAAATLGATVLAAKRQLLTETNALFENQLAWIADGERKVAVEVGDQAVQDDTFMLVRVVVAQRISPDVPWSTVWQTDVISRSEALVEVAPEQLGGSSLALWTYRMPGGEVAVDMDLRLDQGTRLESSSSMVLQTGQPTRVGCSTQGGIEQCVFQTVMPLHPSQI